MTDDENVYAEVAEQAAKLVDPLAAELMALSQSVALAFGVPPWVLGLARPPLHVRARTTVRRWARIAVQGWG